MVIKQLGIIGTEPTSVVIDGGMEVCLVLIRLCKVAAEKKKRGKKIYDPDL